MLNSKKIRIHYPDVANHRGNWIKVIDHPIVVYGKITDLLVFVHCNGSVVGAGMEYCCQFPGRGCYLASMRSVRTVKSLGRWLRWLLL